MGRPVHFGLVARFFLLGDMMRKLMAVVFVLVVGSASAASTPKQASGWFSSIYANLERSIKQLIDGLMATVNQWIQDMQAWMIQFLVGAVAGVLNVVGYWVKPFVDYMTILLPDPTGIGFRYIFEAYHFMSVWFDFDALYYVVVMLTTVHLFVAALWVCHFALTWIHKFWEALPLN